MLNNKRGTSDVLWSIVEGTEVAFVEALLNVEGGLVGVIVYALVGCHSKRGDGALELVARKC